MNQCARSRLWLAALSAIPAAALVQAAPAAAQEDDYIEELVVVEGGFFWRDPLFRAVGVAP